MRLRDHVTGVPRRLAGRFIIRVANLSDICVYYETSQDKTRQTILLFRLIAHMR